MKITQGQYFEIEEFFTEKCRLVETEFIEEMVDHFTDGIEHKITDGVSFNSALEQTVEEFGGIKAIRKMQWEFQKAFVKKQIREWWALSKEYLKKPKIYRTISISLTVTLLTFYVCLFTSGHSDPKHFLSGFISGALIAPIVFVLAYFAQFYLGWFKSFGLVKAQHFVNAGISISLSTTSIVLFVVIDELHLVMMVKALLLSVLWSVILMLYLATIDYSRKTGADSWYQMR